MTTRTRFLSLALSALFFASIGVASAEGRRGPTAARPKTEKADKHVKARSLGSPNQGHLEGAIVLHASKHLRNRQGAHSWGLPDLVHMIRRASDEVAKKHARSMMLVGDLSGRTGGFLQGHNSHQSGRDADIGFYVVNAKGKPVQVKHYVQFDGQGKGKKLEWAYFDDARNWALVEALLKDEKAHVRYIFIASPLRARLLAYAAKKQVAKDVVQRAAITLVPPQEADPHDDHFHVRISCPEGQKETCTEESIAHAKGDETAPGDGADVAKDVKDPNVKDAKDAPAPASSEP